MNNTIRATSYVITNFQNECHQTGKTRALLLDKVIAAAIAYAAPCFNGTDEDALPYYRDSVMGNAIKIVSQINERIFINIDAILEDCRTVWFGRYYMLNSPVNSNELANFKASLSTTGTDVSGEYGIWITRFFEAVRNDWALVSGLTENA